MEIDFENTFDNSQIKNYQVCQRQYYLQYIKGLRKRGSDITNMDIEYGSRVHDFLELYYQKKPVNVEEIWGGYKNRDGELAKTKQNGMKLCAEYHTENAAKDQDIELLEVERVSVMDIDGIAFIVKSDAVIRIKENIYGFEHKTTGSIKYNYFEQFFINSQPSAQAYSVKERYKECSGIYYNVIGTQFLKRKSKDREAGLNFTFKRRLVDRNSRELIWWKDNMVKWAKRINESKRTGEWLVSDGGNACNNYRGCPFLELCKSGCDEQIEQTLYETIDPYDYLKEEK